MKHKEIRQVLDDITRITTWDERWYVQTETDEDGNITRIIEFPSVTWIADSYPKGMWFATWLAKHGLDEAQAIRDAAGDKGHKVHQAITKILRGESIGLDSAVENSETGALEPISLAEYECVMAFVDWFKTVDPVVVDNERVLFNEEHRFAGTADFLCQIDGQMYLIDFKTSQYIWPSHEIQVAAYAHTLPVMPTKLAILQLGYQRNKNAYKLTEIKDKFGLFLATKEIWANEHGTKKLLQKDYPNEISLPSIKRADLTTK